MAPQSEQVISTPHVRKPPWLKIKPPSTRQFHDIRELIKTKKLHTVCEEAHCPNMSECWSGGTATFMVLGEVCTRACKFCAVDTGYPRGVTDPEEPFHVAEAVKSMNLDYVVLTSVDRDDLDDGGAAHFAACIREIKKQSPETLVEVLTPDFQGDQKAVEKILDAEPNVFAHNVETVRRLQQKARDPRATYEQSLAVLKYAKAYAPHIYTKSGIMIGIGENTEEVNQTMQDLRAIGVSVFTIGQYLQPSEKHLKLGEYVPPGQFEQYKTDGERLGFSYVASGPFVRSSYKAGELFMKNLIKQENPEKQTSHD